MTAIEGLRQRVASVSAQEAGGSRQQLYVFLPDAKDLLAEIDQLTAEAEDQRRYAGEWYERYYRAVSEAEEMVQHARTMPRFPDPDTLPSVETSSGFICMRMDPGYEVMVRRTKEEGS